MGFAFNVREKGGGSSASGWSRHGIWTPLCGLLLKVCNVKFHKVSFSSVLFNLMFKIVQRLQQEMVVLFTHKASKFGEREHESRDGIRWSRHVDSYSYFPIAWVDQKEGERKLSRGWNRGRERWIRLNLFQGRFLYPASYQGFHAAFPSRDQIPSSHWFVGQKKA